MNGRQVEVGREPWNCQVDVYLTPREGERIPGYELKTMLPWDGNRIVFRNYRRPGFIIKFILHGEDRYNFPPNPMHAVWSHARAPCPDAANPVWDIFLPMAVDPVERSLTVYNSNERVSEFTYTLNIVCEGQAGLLPLDPGGVNQNDQHN